MLGDLVVLCAMLPIGVMFIIAVVRIVVFLKEDAALEAARKEYILRKNDPGG